VKFDAPAQFESAYVNSLEGADCPVHAPFVHAPLTTIGLTEDPKLPIFPNRAREWDAFMARAAATKPILASAATPEEKLECNNPNVPAAIADFVPPNYPNNIAAFFIGDIVIKLALGEDGKVQAMRMDRTSRDKAYDGAAASAVFLSKFAPEIYHCKPVTADLYFDVKFSQDAGDRPNLGFRPPTGGLQGQGVHF
jgi:hypothetical protein